MKFTKKVMNFIFILIFTTYMFTSTVFPYSITTQQTKTREEHKVIWFISLERPVNIP